MSNASITIDKYVALT